MGGVSVQLVKLRLRQLWQNGSIWHALLAHRAVGDVRCKRRRENPTLQLSLRTQSVNWTLGPCLPILAL